MGFEARSCEVKEEIDKMNWTPIDHDKKKISREKSKINSSM